MKHYTTTLQLAYDALEERTRDDVLEDGCLRCHQPFLIPLGHEPHAFCSNCAYFALEELAVAVIEKRASLPLTNLA